MRGLRKSFILQATSWFEPNIRGFVATRQPQIWILAVVIGVLVGAAAVLFRTMIGVVQLPWLFTMSEHVVTAAREQPWWAVFLAPVIGGLIVGWLIHNVMPGKRALGVADVMEARAAGGYEMDWRAAWTSALISILSLGAGASAGREGPMVHLGAAISSLFTKYFGIPKSGRRTLLAAGAASAVAASFNTPIAGIIFAHEVILGHYALSAFVPIVISAVMGAAICRIVYGDGPTFFIPSLEISSFFEIPAFAMLGIVCALVAVIFQYALIFTDWLARQIEIPLWSRPVFGGVFVGAVAIQFPEVLGVGYEAIDMALKSEFSSFHLFLLLIFKTACIAVTLASRFGGGVFSPALVLGALAGSFYGAIAAPVFPELASSQGLYALLGMGAVAGAVIGAPLSTAIMVFELTGTYSLSIAVLLCVSIATGVSFAVHGRSFFHYQLERRGIYLQEGPHRYLMRTIMVRDFMKAVPDGAVADPHDGAKPSLNPRDSLETALKLFDSTGENRIPVTDPVRKDKVLGMATRVKALSRFNKALIDATVEEHR